MDSSLCVDCYKVDFFLPLGCQKSIMDTSEMIAVLKKSNYQIGDDTEAHHVQEIYYMDLLAATKHQRLSRDIVFLKYSANDFCKSSSLLVNRRLIFELIDGGRFISDTVNLPDEDIPIVLQLMAAFVKVKTG